MQSYQAHISSGGIRDCGTFFLDACGRFDVEHTTVTWSDEPRPSNPQIDRLIEKTWAEQTAQPRRNLFNGSLCRLLDCDARDGKLSLLLAPVSFKEFLGTNLTHPHIRYVHGLDVLADAVGVSAAITTGDGFLLLGRRSESVAFHAGMIHPIGGMVEPADVLTSTPCPFDSMIKELAEETSLSAGSVREIVCVGLVRDKRIVQPELIFDITVDTDRETVQNALADAIDGDEHSELVPVCNHPDAIVSFLAQRSEELTPVATASLLLHGLRNWGSGWFAAARGSTQGVV